MGLGEVLETGVLRNVKVKKLLMMDIREGKPSV